MQRSLGRYLLLVIIIISSLYTFPILAQQQNSKEIVIVFDTAHKPVLTNYTKAFEYLNESMGGILRVYYLNDTLDYPMLSGVHAYIIPAFNKTFSDTETRIIREYLDRGGKVIILGLDYRKGRKYNPDVVVINSLIADLDLNVTIRFNVTGGFGITAYDPLSDDMLVRITNKHFTEKFQKEFFNESLELIVETNILTVEDADITKLPAVLLPPQVYAVSGDGTILYFESGAGTMVCLEKGKGKVAIIGFGLSFSDLIVSGYNKSWIDMGNNKDFWIKFMQKFLGYSTQTTEKQYTLDIAIYSLALMGVILLIVGLYLLRKAPRKEVKAKKEVKLSEILKKMRKE